jgi:hypothetical protein
MADGALATQVADVGGDTRPYLRRPVVLAPIFLAFPLITLPIAALTLTERESAAALFTDVFVWALGITHFVVTFAVYLSSKNLAHFKSTPTNRLVYFGVPAVIFLYFSTIWMVDRTAHPNVEIVRKAVSAIVRVATFLHLGRQSFGVLQMMKGQSGLKFDPQMRKLEQTFFFLMPLLQAETTFLGEDRFARDHWLVWATLAFAFVLFVAIIRLGLRAQGDGPRRIPIAYFCVQTCAAVASIIDMRLYLAANATHYAEYHLLMYPRMMRQELGSSLVDRAMRSLRSSPYVLYGVVLVASTVVSAFVRNWGGLATLIDAGPKPFGFFFHLLDGIFLFHFFVEAFIWKFGNPYYGAALKGLYGGAKR